MDVDLTPPVSQVAQRTPVKLGENLPSRTVEFWNVRATLRIDNVIGRRDRGLFGGDTRPI